MAQFRRVEPAQLPVSTVALARALIGCALIRESEDGRTAGRIIETEAYLPNDPASHAYAGLRPRNGSMFLGPFHSYVYQIYGMHCCFNISSEDAGSGAAVLIRALEPIIGLDLMHQRRGTQLLRDLCRGPGRLCAALGIDRSFDGLYLPDDDRLWLAEATLPVGRLGVSRRIGITKAADLRLRYYERGNPLVSGPRSLSS